MTRASRITAGDRLPGDPDKNELLEQIIRVDQAGEYGAKRIYEGQLAVLGKSDAAPVLREMLAPLGPVGLRRMFGKTGVFCDGVMLGIVADNVLYLRVDEGNRVAFAEAADEAPLNYRKGGRVIDLAFWRAPDRLFDDPDALVAWARLALGAARRVAAGR